MRKSVILAILVLAAPLVFPPPGHATCAAPSLVVQQERVERGEVLIVRGEAFSGCNDTPSACKPWENRARSAPYEGIDVEVRRPGRLLGAQTVDAEADGSFDVRLRVPADARPGPAEVVASGWESYPESTEPVRIEVLP